MAKNTGLSHDPFPKPTPKKTKNGRAPADDRYKISERWKTNKRKRIEQEAKQKSAGKKPRVRRGTARFKRRLGLAKPVQTATSSC